MLQFHEADVDQDVIEAVARQVFGAHTTVRAWRFLGSGSSNLAYQVSVSTQEQPFVFRFNRGFREDVYDTEAANYSAVVEATGVRVPEIVVIDRDRAVVPTAFMVLEYLTGHEYAALCRTPTAGLTPRQRDGIRRQVGDFYARLHRLTRSAAPGEGGRTIRTGIAQYADAATDYLGLDRGLVAECERAVDADPALSTTTLALCMAEGEIYFERRGDDYELAFVCDLEWVGFGHPLADLSWQASPDRPFIDLDHPVALVPADLRRDAFFVAYEQRGGAVDYEAMPRLARYTQLSAWGLVAAEPAEAAKKRWIRDERRALINDLLHRVAAG